MSEQNNVNGIHRMEDDILEAFYGEQREAALDLVAFLHGAQLSPVPDGAKDWKVPYKEYSLCMIQFEPNKWRFTFYFGDYSGDFDESFKSAVQEHVQTCRKCHDHCTGGLDAIVFGKEFTNVCSQLTVQFENPDNRALEHIKVLIEYGKKIAPDSVSWHAHH